MDVKIQPIPVLKDNYVWLVQSSHGGCVVIDPGEAAPIREIVGDNPLLGILLTHHHRDHTGGADSLKDYYHSPIYGPSNVRVNLDAVVRGGETLSFEGLHFQVLSTPGHADEHVSYVLEEKPALFSGDVLFSGGSGRLLEGSAEELYTSFRKYDGLSDETILCPGHEYTEGNMKFIRSLGKVGKDFEKREQVVRELRAVGKPSVPVTMGMERRVNPFLQARSCEEFSRLRALKDNF